MAASSGNRVTVLGLDVDTHKIGAALVVDGLPLSVMTVTLRGKTLDDRLADLVRGKAGPLLGWARQGGTWPDLVATEDRNVERNQQTTNKLNEIVGALKAELIRAGFAGRFAEVNAARKLTVIGLSTRLGRDAIKAATVKLVSLMCQAQGVPPPANDHEADAVLVARAGYLDYRLHKESIT